MSDIQASALPRTLCLTGADGAGKSTQAERLAHYLRGQGHEVRVCTIWDLMAPGETHTIPFHSKDEIDRFLGGLHPPARTMFLHMAMREALDRALTDRGNALVLVVGYWPKYNATERLYGAPAPLLDGLAASFPCLSLGLQLDLAPEVALARKTEVSAYESGGLGKEGFLDFQRRVTQELERCRVSACASWRLIDANATVQVVAGVIENHVDEWLAKGAGA
jgi:dTMP kinase